MAIKLSEESTKQLLANCDKHRIPVDYRLVSRRRDHGYDYRLKTIDNTVVARIWYLWLPGDELCWVEFLTIEDVTYIEDKPSMWPRDAAIEPT